ncbi:hypothetical protein Agub_g236 [Astrephomene gubernaculifera]|uniref:Protein phosphatase n=1 Tax=Astrephomene gubernaculifera TaxID=47775 RepID=A0AAD3DFF4_9CHLO|nr:hypothetical protein Agub_g236 [Astrephomene gubernaculifera]
MAIRRVARLLGAVYELQVLPAAARASTAAAATITSSADALAPTAPHPRRALLQFPTQATIQHVQAVHTYTLTITTGNRRGAGSLAPAWVQLVGTNGKSERILVGETDEDRLARGSVRTVSVPAPEELGQLRFVNVQRLGSSISDAGTGWFLEHVVVETPEQQRLYFPCHAWFGEADAGVMHGPLERNLLPAAPEDAEIASEPVRLSASGMAVPHPDKVKQDGAKGVNRKGFGHGGEDSYFYCAGKNGVFALGVADGVFMWRESGIDSGVFSRALMKLSEQSVQAGSADVVKVMQDAAAGAAASGVKGSSTACIVLVNQDTGQLWAANLGDSGCLLLRPATAPPAGGDGSHHPHPAHHPQQQPYQHHPRHHAHPNHHQQQHQLHGRNHSGSHHHSHHPHPGHSGIGRHHGRPLTAAENAAAAANHAPPVPYTVKFRTNQLEHEFGRPYQLGHHEAADSVEKCDVAMQAVRPGDVLVLGTDGLLDNLSDAEIAREVAVCRSHGSGPSVIAHRLARLAFEASYDKSRSTPYSTAASEHFDMVYSGGKPDDITVLCAICE